MASGIKVTTSIQGLREMDQALTALGDSTRKSVLRRVLKHTLEPVAETAAALAPRGTRPAGRRVRLADSIRIKSRLKSRVSKARYAKYGRSPYGAMMFVGPSVPHAHLIEFGHQIVKGTRGGGNRRVVGFAPAHPFMRPAWDKHRAQLATRFREAIWPEIQRVARLWARQARRGKLSKRARAALTGRSSARLRRLVSSTRGLDS